MKLSIYLFNILVLVPYSVGTLRALEHRLENLSLKDDLSIYERYKEDLEAKKNELKVTADDKKKAELEIEIDVLETITSRYEVFNSTKILKWLNRLEDKIDFLTRLDDIHRKIHAAKLMMDSNNAAKLMMNSNEEKNSKKD